MKLNIILITTCILWAGQSAYAERMPTAPQSANNNYKHQHGVPTKIDLKAPTPKRSTEEFVAITANTIDKSKLQTSTLMSSSAMAAVACNVNAFATANTATLISELKTQGPSCINELFSAASNVQVSTFSSDNMNAVANHVKGLSTSYAGGGDADIEGLFLYLRAGYYVEFYNDGVSFASWVKPAIKDAIDAFVNNANFYQDNDGHGQTLSEVLITIDSSEQQDVYLSVVKEWLSRWDQSMAAKWNMRSAVNSVFTILFRGQYNTNFRNLVATDTTLVTRLQDFVMSSWMIDSDAEYLIANAARELGRLKMYTNSAIQTNVDAALNVVFNSSYVSYGYGDAVWLAAADSAGYYSDCADFGICNYKAELEANALSQLHVCSATIKIRSQNLTSIQQSSACSTMAAEETYFHSKLQTGNVAIPGDNNSQLQVNIFDSSADYGKYAGHIFGINTNNGGMYLEGDPSVVGNVPNFIAYEASYAEPEHYVWNLEHEYVHYLDGRFDLFGNFSSPTEEVVWWAEGVAEYVANQNDNQAAIDTVNDGSTFTLGTVFNTNYDGFDQDRIYRWGYLAVRFMFENHFTEVKAMLAETRAGNWTAYKARVTNWASDYGPEFTTWTQNLSNTTPPDNVAPTANANGPYSALVNDSINFESTGSTDSDGTIESMQWNFGDGSTSNQENPSHTYTSVGNFTAILTVTDNGNLSDIASVAVTITDTSTGTVITNGETKTNLSAATGDWSFFTIEVPNNATDLVISTSGGSGDVDMYTQFSTQPAESIYACRPYASGNNESCAEASPSAGTWHIGLKAYGEYSGVNLTASYTDGTVVNQAPVAQLNGPYSAAVNAIINFSSNGSTDPDGSIAAYSWDFGDNTTSTLANPSHSYATADIYTVSLTVTDNLGLTHTASTTATTTATNQAPLVFINGPYLGDIDVAMNFSSAGSSDPDGSIASYSWSFGDGTTSNQAEPAHTYTTANTFTVSLSITDNQGLTETATTTATVIGINPPDGVLTNGVVQNISGVQDSESNFTLEVPAGATNLSISINGGSGDADIFVNLGSAATQSNYQCRPYKTGNDEVCDITDIQAGTYHVMVRGYNAYDTNLTGSFTAPDGSSGNVPNVCLTQGSQTSGEVQDGTAICLGNAEPIWLSVGDVNGHNSIAISVGNGTGDLSIDFSNSGWPNGSNHHGSSNNAENNECIYLSNLSEYWGYIKVSGNAEGAALVVDYDTAGCR
jgi:microbial collagenase